MSIDPRTTEERYGNESQEAINIEKSMNTQMRARIERFRSMQKLQTVASNTKNRKIKEPKECIEGTFKLNAADRDIKVSAADEVAFNFRRRH